MEYFRKINKLGFFEMPRLSGTSIYFFIEKRETGAKKLEYEFANLYVIKLRSPILYRKNFSLS